MEDKKTSGAIPNDAEERKARLLAQRDAIRKAKEEKR